MKLMVSDFKKSFEGEGERLGMKTAFFRYPGTVEVDFEKECRNKVGALFVVSSLMDTPLLQLACDFPMTIETSMDDVGRQGVFDAFIGASKVWVVTHRRDFCILEWVPPLQKNVMIKIEIFLEEDILSRLQVANWYGSEGYQVLLMPTYDFDSYAMGKLMTSLFDSIHPNVRFMPPIQKLLGII